MSGQMCWLSSFGSNGTKILHLREHPNQPWRPYKSFPGYAVPDYRVPGGSKGWSTYQKLFNQGWALVPSPEVQEQGIVAERQSA
jgi:hypothetical protein